MYQDLYSFSEWQGLGYDTSSTIDQEQINSRLGIDVIFNETSTNKTLYLNGATNVIDVNDNIIENNFTLSPYSNIILFGNNLELISTINSATTLNSETLNYISGLANNLSSSKLNKIDTFVTNLKSILNESNLQNSIDLMYIINNENEYVALRNLISGNFDLQKKGTNLPTFYENDGILNTGLGYLDTNYYPNSSNSAMTKDSITFMIGFKTKNVGTTGVHGCYSTTADSGSANRIVIACAGSDWRSIGLNGGVATINSGITAPGIITAVRTTSSNIKQYYNTTKILDTSNNSTKTPDQKLLLLAMSAADGSIANYVYDKIEFAAILRGTTESEIQNIVNAWNTYKQ